MSPAPIAQFADFLAARAAMVKTLEAEAEALIHDKKDQAGYAAKMREKALLLSELAEDAKPFTEVLDPALKRAAADRLERFAGSASMSLSVGSVFFMSALLYPDDHRPGEPNDLENYAVEVRSWG